MRGADRLIAALEARGGRHRLRPARRRVAGDPRRAARLADPPRARAPRGRRGPRRRGLRARPPGASASRSSPAARARRTSSPRSPTPTWTRCRRVFITAQVPSHLRRHDGVPGVRRDRHDAPDRQALDRGRGAPTTSRARSTRRSTSRARGRPGPVLVDVPADAAKGLARRTRCEAPSLPGYRTRDVPNGRQLRRAAAAIAEARRPVLYAGGGVVHAEALRPS